MDHCIEEAFASALGVLAITRIFFDVGGHAGVENAFAIVRGIKATIEVEIGASEVQPHLFGQRASTLSGPLGIGPCLSH